MDLSRYGVRFGTQGQTLVNNHSKTRGFVMSLATYSDTEREDTRGIINVVLRICFWAAPHPVAHPFTNNVTSRR
jgi:hypothetical protein